MLSRVEQTLRDLRRRGTLIVCYTESLAYYSQYRFRKLGLDHLVDYLYSPRDHDLPEGMSREDIRFHEASHYKLKRTEHRFTPPGELKPNPDILSSILRDLGVRPDQAIYIGDSAHKDIWMAQRAGVLDAQALYGAAQHRDTYALLRAVSHWSDDDVERERMLIGNDEVVPTYRLDGFADLLDIVDFTTFKEVRV
ncbi:HAD family hydrolase [Sphingomonas sp.]|uniref:HAD family hydrolase n=1 Tax=Sphingomonas sp. TaxID=28214 RepID=UPI002FDB7684